MKTQDWKAFGSKYLKAEDVTSDTNKYVITKVTSETEDDKETLIFSVEREGITKLFGCNATNEQAVKAECPNSPEQALGKILTFFKVQVTNPTTKQIVDGLRLKFFKEEQSDSGINSDGTV